MFTRAKRVKQNGRVYEYLMVVETLRTGKRVSRRTVINFGRSDLLESSM